MTQKGGNILFFTFKHFLLICGLNANAEACLEDFLKNMFYIIKSNELRSRTFYLVVVFFVESDGLELD